MQATISRYTTGINNKVDPARIPYDKSTGVTDLEGATDVLIDKSGGLTTRRGSAIEAAGSYHSGFPIGDERFFAVIDRNTDSALGVFTPQADGSLDVDWIRSGMTKAAKVSYCLVDGKYYYQNGYESGVIEDSVSSPWPTSEWPRETDVQFVQTPIGTHLDMLSGRFIIARGSEIIWTEPGLFGLVDNNRNWRKLESKVLMVYSVGTGAFISDEKAVYWCAGRDPHKWVLEKVLNYPAIEHARVPGVIDPSLHGLETSKD